MAEVPRSLEFLSFGDNVVSTMGHYASPIVLEAAGLVSDHVKATEEVDVAIQEMAAMIEHRQLFVRCGRDEPPFLGAFNTAMTVIADAERGTSAEESAQNPRLNMLPGTNGKLVKDALRRAGVRLDIHTEERIEEAARMIWGQTE